MAVVEATFLAIMMLLTGSLNTITNSFMDKIASPGITNPSTFWSWVDQQNGQKLQDPPAFDHPFVQAVFMFIGEATCMLVFMANNVRSRRTNPDAAWTNQHGWRATFCYASTAMCDLTATSIMYAGLALSSPSIYQMLRGAIIIFTALNSVFFLRRRLYAFQWSSIAVVVVGVIIVGFQSVDGSEGNQSGLVLGIVLILLAQVVQSFQVVLQEKFITTYGTPALRLVGLEGIFGGIMLSVLLVPMYFIEIEGYPIENAPDAWRQILNSPSELPTGHKDWHLPVGNALFVAVLGNVFSIAFFNYFGINITRVLSGAHRMVLDSMRTFVVWGVSLCLYWEKFQLLQLIGFLVMLFGTATYNEYIRFPFLFNYPPCPSVARTACDEDMRDVPLKDNSNALNTA